QLVEIFGTDADAGRNYVASLEEELKRRTPTNTEWRIRSGESSGDINAPLKMEHLIACLRKSPQVDSLLTHLLRSREDRVRELAREILLPELVNRLPAKVNAAELRRRLDQLCPDDLLEKKILLSLPLAKLGVDLAAANACLAQLQQERPVTC